MPAAAKSDASMYDRARGPLTYAVAFAATQRLTTRSVRDPVAA